MMKPKHLLSWIALLTAMDMSGSPMDQDEPAYKIVNQDSICQIFVYSPAANQGLHLAYLTDDDRWIDVGQHAGDTYIASELDLPAALKRYVGTSVVKDSKTDKTWLKVVNALPRVLKLNLNGLGNKTVEIQPRSSQVIEL